MSCSYRQPTDYELACDLADQREWDGMTPTQQRARVAEQIAARKQAAQIVLSHAVPIIEKMQTPPVLVPATQVVRRVGYFLRMCGCGHVGRANFHGPDDGAAFELITAKTWACGFCQTNQPNPGRDDADYLSTTHPVKKNWRHGFTDSELEGGDARCDAMRGT